MDAMGSGHYALWNWNPLPGKPNSNRPQRQRRFDSKSESYSSAESDGGSGFRFPFKQAVPAGSLALTGGTIAQLTQRWRKAEAIGKSSVLDSGGSGQVLLNQIILGPSVITVIFAWNNLWLGKLSELPEKYRKDALRTLLYGFRFWIPVSALNFWVVPLQARVAFMSMGSIFWNFYLSSTMTK